MHSVFKLFHHRGNYSRLLALLEMVLVSSTFPSIGVAANRLGFIFVSDSTNHRVEKFTSDGHFLLTFGTNGPIHGNFVYPEGIALLGEEKVYVADHGNDRIQVSCRKTGNL